MRPRVLIAGFKHETNTFSRLPTTLDSYRARALHRDNEIATLYPGTNTEVAAFLDGCTRHGWQPVLSVVADATPSGPLTRDCYEAIAADIVAAATQDGAPAAILLNLHGAMVAEHVPDGEGELLARLRAAVGPATVIAATLDLHANVSDRMAQAADILVSYRTYPHVDMYEIAGEAVDLVARTLAGAIRPRTIVRRGPQLTGIDDGRTTSPGPMTEALAIAARHRQVPGVLSVSVNAGFTKADTPEAGPSAIVVGDSMQARYEALADELVAHFWRTRHDRTISFTSPADAVARAKAGGRIGAPVILADFADNPGGGGYSDSTGILRAMIEADLENAAIATIVDPACAAACHSAGLGAELDLAIGGKIDPAWGAPVTARGIVTHLSGGAFTITGPMQTGMRVALGPTATFKVGGVEIVLASQRFQNYDLGFFRIGGIEPAERAVLVVKSMQHFRAAYAPIAGEIIVVDDGGGVTSHDVARLPFRHLRRPIYPIDLD